MMIGIAFLCGWLLFLTLVLLALSWRRGNRQITQRMRYYAGDLQQTMPTKDVQDTQLRVQAIRAIRWLAATLQRLRRAQNLDLKMQQAGWPLLGSEFLAMVLCGSAAGAGFVMLLTLRFTFAAAAFAGLLLLAFAGMHWQIERRRKAFTNQLGDCLTMAANALRAGFSFLQAMELISREMESPIKEEFARVIREMNLGAQMEKALSDMDARVESSDFGLVVTAVLIQRQVGGNLAQILDTISETINDRIRMRREVLALTAQGRMSGWVLAALPIGVAAVLSFINPGYLDPLLEEPVGRMAIAGAVVMEIIGFVVIQRIVDIDV